MKDGNLSILYTKETHPHLHSALYPTEQQSSRATEQQSSLQVTRPVLCYFLSARLEQITDPPC
jgi:hypothetical protein